MVILNTLQILIIIGWTVKIIHDKSHNFCNNNNVLLSLILNTIHPIGNEIFT